MISLNMLELRIESSDLRKKKNLNLATQRLYLKIANLKKIAKKENIASHAHLARGRGFESGLGLRES